MTVGTVKEDLAAVVRGIVDDRDAVLVDELEGSDSTVLELRVANDDLGKVIGRQGRIVRALRSLLKVRSETDRRAYELEIVED